MPDWTNPKAKKIAGKVVQERRGVSIELSGHGTCNMGAGFGSPIFIENERGIVSVYVWDDINQEEYSQKVSLDGAQESRRIESEG